MLRNELGNARPLQIAHPQAHNKTRYYILLSLQINRSVHMNGAS